MANFVQNLNKYIDHHNIKRSFVAKRAGIEKNKLSRILNNVQDITNEDMIAVAESLDKDIGYFFQADLDLSVREYKESASIAFYMGTADEGKKELANQAFDLLEHIDAIFSIRKKLERDSREASIYGL